jgi:hypothetical protein
VTSFVWQKLCYSILLLSIFSTFNFQRKIG